MQDNPAVCIFRGGIIQSPWARHPVPAFKPTSETRAVQSSLLLISRQKHPEHPGSGKTKTGKSHPPLGACSQIWVWDMGHRTPSFSIQYHQEKNTSRPSMLSLLFTKLSCSPGLLEIAGKPSSPPGTGDSCSCPFRMSLEEAAAAGRDGDGAG